GLLETVYEIILAHQLRQQGLEVIRQVAIPIEYHGLRFEEGFRADLIIENKVIVELKCIERLNNAHKKQLLTYLRLTGMRLGFLLNFSESLMKNGIHRTVNCLIE
ncbi:MAG: GxxExxY protein, partial [Pseudomonadota bacterium]